VHFVAHASKSALRAGQMVNWQLVESAQEVGLGVVVEVVEDVVALATDLVEDDKVGRTSYTCAIPTR